MTYEPKNWGHSSERNENCHFQGNVGNNSAQGIWSRLFAPRPIHKAVIYRPSMDCQVFKGIMLRCSTSVSLPLFKTCSRLESSTLVLATKTRTAFMPEWWVSLRRTIEFHNPHWVFQTYGTGYLATIANVEDNARNAMRGVRRLSGGVQVARALNVVNSFIHSYFQTQLMNSVTQLDLFVTGSRQATQWILSLGALFNHTWICPSSSSRLILHSTVWF